jgi:hypothetical protein
VIFLEYDEKMKILQIKPISLLVIGSICIIVGTSFTSVFLSFIINQFFYPGNYGDFGNFVKFLFAYGWIGTPFLIPGIVIFYKSPIIRKSLGYE